MILILLLIVSFIFPVVSGLLLVSLFWPNAGSNRSLFWVKALLSTGAGIGIASLNLSLSTLLTGSVNPAFIAGEVLILTALIVTRRYASKREISGSDKQTNQIDGKKPALGLSLFFFGLLALQQIVFVLLSLKAPHGTWDAVAFWNTRARLLFRAGEHWKDVFNLLGGVHADYPFLLPDTVVRFWSYAGRETIIAAPLAAFLFTFATIGLLVISLSFLRGRTQGLIGGLFILSTPFFISHGASQYADVPFGFYVLAAIALVNISDEFAGANRGLLALAGLMAGLAAWTKNEGLLFLVSLVVGLIVIELWRARSIRFGRGVLAFAGGALPVLMIAFYFKAIATTNNDLVAGQGAQSLRQLADLSRYNAIFNAVLEQVLALNSIPLALLALYAFFLKGEPVQLKRTGLAASTLALSLMLAGYGIVFLTTPYDLAWHLGSSLDRLLLQLWPSVIFISLMVVRSPRQRVQEKSNALALSHQDAAI